MSELLLLSGGIDSISLAAWRRPACCLTIDYGQLPAAAEMESAREICRMLQLVHDVIRVPIDQLGAGTLVGGPSTQFSSHEEFWPFLNQFLLTLGAMYAIKKSFNCVLIGTVRNDVRHSDGSPVFLALIADLVVKQEGQIKIAAPASGLSTVELVRASGVQPAVLGWAHSCHTADIACGSCSGCHKHSETMEAIGWNR
jgi:7-cyano-7-deazaguanine synthase